MSPVSCRSSGLRRGECGVGPGLVVDRPPGPPLGGNVTACASGDEQIHLLAVGADNRMHGRSTSTSSRWDRWVDGLGRARRGWPVRARRHAGRGVPGAGAPGGLLPRPGRQGPAERPGGCGVGGVDRLVPHRARRTGRRERDRRQRTCPDHLQLLAVGTDEAVITAALARRRAAGRAGPGSIARAFLDTATPAVVSRHPGALRGVLPRHRPPRVVDGGTRPVRPRRVVGVAAPRRPRPGRREHRRLCGRARPRAARTSSAPISACTASSGSTTAGWSGWYELDGGARFTVDATPTRSPRCPVGSMCSAADRDGHVRHHVASTLASIAEVNPA